MVLKRTSDWNINVLAKWNPDILTPLAIGRYIFKVEESTPLDIEVPLNRAMPPRVTHHDLAVTVSNDRLVVECKVPEYAVLQQAVDAACAAVEELPRTPFIAVGVNVGFIIEDSAPDLLHRLQPSISDQFSDAGWPIEMRQIMHRLSFNNGVINVTAIMPTADPMQVKFNLHRSIDTAEGITEWLRLAGNEANAVVDRLLTECFGLPEYQSTEETGD